MPTTHATILVVDDEPSIQRYIVEILTPRVQNVLEAHHGLHALQLCKQHPGPIHLLLTDVVMPHMNGRELASAALAVRPQMRVLCISSAFDDSILEGLVQENKVAFLQKPFSPDALIQKVRDVLGTAA